MSNDLYKKSGVDVEAGDKLVDWLTQDSDHIPDQHKSSIVSGVGGFASLFRLNTEGMSKPCLVTCTDGVGTKVLLATQYEAYESVAQDMVAMCVNDLITTGADPLLFLDYYATGKLDLEAAQKFLAGVKRACFLSDCALVGGETAEMPGVYRDKDFDCAGFAVGIVDEEKRLGPHLVKEGDVAIGISSSGFHSNGYSLLRNVFKDDLDQWKDVLLKPTHLYVRFAKALRHIKVNAIAHITGGGIENIPRVLPENLGLELKQWDFPEEFKHVQRRTKMSDLEMLNTLNCGIGLVVIADKAYASEIKRVAKEFKFKPYDIGIIKQSESSLILPQGVV